jgi:hypothetical protein
MNAMIAKYLKDFSVPEPVDAAGGDILDSLAGSSFADLDFGADAEPQVDVEAEKRDAYDHGFLTASEEAETRYQDELATLTQAHAAEIEQLAAAHEADVIGMIHLRFHEMTQALSQSLAEQTLQVLLPVFDEEFCRRSVAELASSVRAALQESGIAKVVVRGPAHLYDRLKPLLDADGIDSQLVESTSLDIAVEINDTVLVTRLAAWAQSLKEVTE